MRTRLIKPRAAEVADLLRDYRDGVATEFDDRELDISLIGSWADPGAPELQPRSNSAAQTKLPTAARPSPAAVQTKLTASSHTDHESISS